MPANSHSGLWAGALLGLALLAGCSGGGDGGSPAPPPSGGTPPMPPPLPPPPPPPPPAATAFDTPESTARFLTQATFGPTPAEIERLTGTSPSDWFRAELAKPESLHLPYVIDYVTGPNGINEFDDLSYQAKFSPNWAFWINAIEGEDQLRQRMAFALSQVLVVSNTPGNNLFDYPRAMGHYQDVLVENAFGNYRDLLEEVTYSPAMADYLTYLQNRKGDPDSGRMPDENYARELMQLFTIGLVELQQNGEPVRGPDGDPVEIYDNSDVTGLARVFTGLSFDGGEFWQGPYSLGREVLTRPLVAFPDQHSELEKSFLGTTIPAGTSAEESIDIALDTLFEHPNTAPFLARQLIQRFVTSHPEPDYVARVASAFEAGRYVLPDGSNVGTGERGDLSATLAAVLFDEAARGDAARESAGFGKVREPVLRFTAWARAFDAGTVTPDISYPLYTLGQSQSLGQAPYQSPSVFNFYRPGYVAPGTETGQAGLTMPELQLVNASTSAGYVNFMTYYAFARAAEYETGPEGEVLIPDYSAELPLADDVPALVERLDLLFTYGTLSQETRASIEDIVSAVPIGLVYDPDYDGRAARVAMAVTLITSSPDFIVQR